MKAYTAEFLGTFWLVFAGCGAAMLSAGVPEIGIGLAGVSLAFGLSVLTMAYALGHVSGAHLNPAVTIGFWAAGSLSAKQVLPYIAAQVVGALTGAAVLFVIVTGNGSPIGDFAANGYGEHSPGNYTMLAVIVTEFVLTFMFMLIILGSTYEKAPRGFAGIAVGLGLTLIHLVSIPVDNCSVNPARSISQAVFAGGWALSQVWLFILVPVIGTGSAGLIARYIRKEQNDIL